MIPYLIIFIIALTFSIFALKDSKKYWLFSWISIIAISLLIGLRYNTGIDWLHFDQCYRRIVLGYNVDIELGFKALSILFGKYFGLGSWTIFTVMAVSFVFPLYFLGRENMNYLYIFVPLFICLNLTNSLTVSRQYAAMGMILCSCKYLSSNDLKKYIVCCLLAILLHSTSFMFAIIFYLLYHLKWIGHRLLKTYLVLFFISFILQKYSDSIFTYIYDNFNFIAIYVGKESYVDNINIWADKVGMLENTDTPFRMAINKVSTLLLICYGDKFLKSHENKFYFFIYHLSVIGLIIYPIFQSQELLKRLVWYLTIFSPLMYSLIIKEYVFLSDIKKLSVGKILLLVWMIYTLYSYLMQGEAMNYNFL